MIMPGTLSTITAVFSADRRPKAVSVWAGFASSGAILGLLTCGLVLEWFSWRASFVATAVLAVVSFVGSSLMAPNTSDPDEVTIDVPGSVLSAIGVGALVFGIIDGAEVGWSAGSTLAALAVAATSIAGFVWWELRTPEPMLDVRLFRLRGLRDRIARADRAVLVPVRLLPRRPAVPAADARPSAHSSAPSACCRSG